MAVQDGSRKYPKLAYTRNAKDNVDALLTKLVRDQTQTSDRPSDPRNITVSRDLFEQISQATGQDAIDADSVFQLLPDVELTEQILIGSILSPKDMSSVDLNFTADERVFDSEVARPLLSVVQEYFKNDYKIDDRLDGILEEILFTKGAHILAVLPENNLDVIINGSQQLSMESYNKVVSRINKGLPMGFLGHPREPRVSMETFRGGQEAASGISGQLNVGGARTDRNHVSIPGVQVTDNFDVLKNTAIRNKGRQLKINSLLNRHQVSMESASKGLSPEDIDKLYTQRGQQPAVHTQVLPTQEYINKPSAGHPLVMKLPIESVIPVYVPGSPEEHVGYFVMIDQNGRPVVREEGKDYYGELRSNFSANSKDNTSELVKRTKEAMGATNTDSSAEFDQIQQAYAGIIENDLINRLRNGLYGEDFELGTEEDIYRIMLYRSLKNQNTQLLYIPAELVTYMAFAYNKHGIGQTLLTQSKILSSMRSVLLFAETMAGVRNAVGRKRASISVDAEDPDPEKTISDVQAAVLESSHRGFPLASPDPGQTLDYLNRAGFDFSINVESDNYPTTKVEFDDYNTNIQGGNPELQDRLRRMHISGFGINPELVDPTSSPDFATSVVNNNLLMTRRVIRHQKKLTRYLTKHSQLVTRHSARLKAKLEEVLTEQKTKLTKEQKKMETEELIDLFIDSIQTDLPMPDTTRVDLQQQMFEQYTTLLERALEAYITPDLFPAEVLAREPNTVDHVIAVIKAYYQRTWLDRNNIMPELDKLTEMDGKNPVFSLLDIQEGQFSSLGEAIQKYLDGIEEKRKVWEEKNQPEEEEESDDESGDGEGEETTDDESGEASGDEDEFGGEDDFALDEEEESTETEEGTEEDTTDSEEESETTEEDTEEETLDEEEDPEAEEETDPEEEEEPEEDEDKDKK
jgi:hypothetical protein